MKNSIKIILMSLLALGLVTGCGKEKTKEENNKQDTVVNTNEGVIKDQEIDGLKMTNTSLIYENGISTLITEVSNNTGVDYNLNEFNIIVKDANGNVITTLKGYVGGTIPNGEARTINTSSDLDLSKATSIEYSVSK